MCLLDRVYDKREEVQSLALKHGVNKIRLFGSAAKREDTLNSDLDFLVDFDEGRSLFDLIGFKYDLEELFENEVDVITFDSLHKEIKETVLSEMIEI